MKNRIRVAVAALFLSTASFVQTAEQILDKHIAAVGGADKVGNVKSIQYEQAMNMMGMDMTGKSTVVVGKSARTEIAVMGQSIVSVIDGDKGWMINPMMGGTTPQELPAEQVKLSKGNTEPTGLQLAYARTNKYPLELVGKEQYNGKSVFNVKVNRPEGTVNYYVDANSFQVIGSKAVVNVQGQTAEVKADFADFRAVEGLTLPYSVELTAPGMPSTMKTTITKIVINPSVDPAIFAMPK